MKTLMQLRRNPLVGRSLAALASIALAATAASPPAEATQYAFTEIADLGLNGVYSNGYVGLNNSGQVAYYGTTQSDSGSSTYLNVGNGTTTTQVATFGDGPGYTYDGSPYTEFPSINNAGTVAYAVALYGPGNENLGTALYSWNAGATQQLLQSPFDNYESGQINNSGQVAYGDPGTYNLVAITNGGGLSTTIASSANGLAYPFFQENNGLALNDNGTVAFVGQPTDQQTYGSLALFVGNSSQLSIYSTPNGVLGPVSINNQGVVAFSSYNTVSEVTPTSGGVITIATDASQGYSSLFDNVAINNQGELAVTGQDVANAPDGSPYLYGVYAGTSLADLNAAAVIQTGQSLLGLTFGQSLGDVVINDNGQLAFIAELYNSNPSSPGYGSIDDAVVLATPIAVPEPSTLALGALAAVGVCVAGWRRRRCAPRERGAAVRSF